MYNAHVHCYLLSALRIRLFMFSAFTCGQRFSICLLALQYLDGDTDLVSETTRIFVNFHDCSSETHSIKQSLHSSIHTLIANRTVYHLLLLRSGMDLLTIRGNNKIMQFDYSRHKNADFERHLDWPNTDS